MYFFFKPISSFGFGSFIPCSWKCISCQIFHGWSLDTLTVPLNFEQGWHDSSKGEGPRRVFAMFDILPKLFSVTTSTFKYWFLKIVYIENIILWREKIVYIENIILWRENIVYIENIILWREKIVYIENMKTQFWRE